MGRFAREPSCRRILPAAVTACALFLALPSGAAARVSYYNGSVSGSPASLVSFQVKSKHGKRKLPVGFVAAGVTSHCEKTGSAGTVDIIAPRLRVNRAGEFHWRDTSSTPFVEQEYVVSGDLTGNGRAAGKVRYSATPIGPDAAQDEYGSCSTGKVSWAARAG